MKPTFKADVVVATVTLVGMSPYSQSRYIDEEMVPKLDKEKTDAYDARIWREKGHYNKNNELIIPHMQIKNMMANVARYLGEKIPGKGQATYSKHFKAGLLVTEPFRLEDSNGNIITKENVQQEISFPQTNTGNRVKSRYPIVHNGWKAYGRVIIVDQTITKDVFTRYLQQAGLFIGLGRYRVGNGAEYGRFMVDDIEFTNNL